MMNETTTLRRRYPGVQPFKADQKDLFFGRETDIREMLRLIEQEKLLVLYGKSGYGKSSLLNAGIVPRLDTVFRKKTIIPIFIRQRSYVAGESALPIDNVKNELAAKVPNTEGGVFYEQIFAGKTLWHDFKRRQTFPIDEGNPQVFVLIFDQFEEFFLYPLEQQLQFRKQIAELLYTEIPQSVFHELGKVTDPLQREHIVTPLDVRAIFAIREDRLGYLDSMKTEMPAILNKRYQLRGLMDVQAKEAIVEPARLSGTFTSPPFEYSEAAVTTLISKLGETKQTTRIGIEAFQVQILCEYLEGEIMAGHIPQNRIEPSYFADKINEIYEGYYNRQLDKLDPSLQNAAQELIEDSLVFSDDATGESRRLSVDADVLVQRYEKQGITYDLLRILENNFLLRREPNSTGGYNYEVTHDTLIAPIAKSKNSRRREKDRLKKEAEEAERLHQIGETQRQLAIEKRRRQQSNVLLLISLLALVVAVWFYRDAEKAKTLANEKLRQALLEQIGRQKLEIKQSEQKIDIFNKAEETELDSLERGLMDSINNQLKINQLNLDSLNTILDSKR